MKVWIKVALGCIAVIVAAGAVIYKKYGWELDDLRRIDSDGDDF